MNIYLMGYMGCGKTRAGRRLAAHSQRPFTDLDTLFEKRLGTSIPEYFRQHSEESFRQEERQMLHETAGLDNNIIALGGGTPCFEDNIDWIKSHGISVYLKMNELALCQFGSDSMIDLLLHFRGVTRPTCRTFGFPFGA